MKKPSRCDGCAFSPGTEANRSYITLAKAKLLAEICEPFYCHEAKAKGKDRLCIGWADAVDVLNARSYYEQQPAWRRDATRSILNVLIEVEDKLIAGESVDEFDFPSALMAELERAGEQKAEVGA